MMKTAMKPFFLRLPGFLRLLAKAVFPPLAATRSKGGREFTCAGKRRKGGAFTKPVFLALSSITGSFRSLSLQVRAGLNPAAAFLFFLLCLPLPGCKDSPMPGTVASVNGQGISFREAEFRRINRFSGLSSGPKLWSEAEIQAQYSYVIYQIIEELLICQYMESKNLVLEPGLLDAEEKLIRNDYPDGAFDQTLAEKGVNLEEWREILRRRLVIRQFLLQELRPAISITADEVQQYFTEHSADFLVPEQWHFIQISGLDKKTVESARNSFMTNKNATTVQKDFLVSIHDIHMGKDRLPDDLSKELLPLEIWKSSPVKAVGDGFRALVLIHKTPATMLEAAEIAKRVEQALLEEKMRVLYSVWVKKRMAGANIRLAPALFAEKSSPNGPAPDAFVSRNATSGGNGSEQRSSPDFPGLPAREPLAAETQGKGAEK